MRSCVCNFISGSVCCPEWLDLRLVFFTVNISISVSRIRNRNRNRNRNSHRHIVVDIDINIYIKDIVRELNWIVNEEVRSKKLQYS